MYDNQLDYRAIQRLADAAVKRQQFRTRLGLFLANLFLFAAFFLVGWANIGGRGLYPDQFFVSMLLLSIGWFTGLILHGASLWMSSETVARRVRERFLVREIAREMAQLGLDEPDMPIPFRDEKTKRQSRLTLEDGELVETHDWDANEPRQNGTPKG